MVRAGTDDLTARPRRRTSMARLADTGEFGHERAERGTMATHRSRGSAVCQVCPHLRGKLDPPTFDLFCRFTFRLRRTGHTRLMHEKSLEDSLPQSDTRSHGYNYDVEVRHGSAPPPLPLPLPLRLTCRSRSAG